ncbi:MAG: hypothetical protein IPO53_01100 [Chitinophagaceae bacterium]|nr:hypothetical protein [Chitinophagaceae bacterium]
MMEKFYLLTKFCSAVFKRSTVAILFIGFFSSSIYCQPPTPIGGIVNTYHQVLEIIPAKACVRVADPTGLNVNTRVMLVQMKGASIITTNSAAFGDTTSLNEAGNYEIGTICYIIGDSVFLFHTLLNTYSPSSGKVQLVQFAEYYSADVVDTVKAAPWDSLAGTGGVIAIFANQDITLNAPIYADSSGNKGGAYFNNNGTCNLFSQEKPIMLMILHLLPNQNGANKGEGVANIPQEVCQRCTSQWWWWW